MRFVSRIREWLRANGMTQEPRLAYFTDSFGWAILIGAAVALVAAVVVAIYMPPQHLEESEVEHSFEEPVTRPVIQTG